MPYYFEFDTGNRILPGTLEGRITDAEVGEIYRLMSRYVASLNPAAGIFDASGVASFDVSTDTIQYLAACDPPFPPGKPRYIVAPADFLFGMARMFQILGEEKRQDLRVVHSAEEVYRELGVASVCFHRVQLESLSA